MKYWIDRFEGEYAVLEDESRNIHSLLKKEIPKEAKEGDLLIKIEEGYVVDKETTAKRKKEIKDRMNRLFE